MPLFFRRLKKLLHRRESENDIQKELAAHLEMGALEHIEEGASPDEARQFAQREFGNLALAREDIRAQWQWRSLETVRQDVGYAIRLFFKNPGFTAIAVLMLAL